MLTHLTGKGITQSVTVFILRSALRKQAFCGLSQNKNASLTAGTFCAYCDPAGISYADPLGHVKEENTKCSYAKRNCFCFAIRLKKAIFLRLIAKQKCQPKGWHILCLL
jgi:hypothetical protein